MRAPGSWLVLALLMAAAGDLTMGFGRLTFPVPLERMTGPEARRWTSP